jgi:polysaccharide biosynthesis/export protein
MTIIQRSLGLFLLTATAAAAQTTPPAPARMPNTGAAAPAGTPASRPAAPETAASKELSEGYVLGPDDVVDISLIGQPEFQTRARVRANGTIQLPFIGEQMVSGETALTLGPKIAERLRTGGFYAKPVVNVEISSFSSRYVTLLGAVGATGLQPVDREYRLSEVIARAGGIRGDGADYITLTRPSGEQKNYDFVKLASGGPDDDPVVKPGDKIYVPLADTYYVYGQINQPGQFPIRGQMTVRNVIARSGGIGPSGSLKKIKLFRDGKEMKATLDMPVLAGDVFTIGERAF